MSKPRFDTNGSQPNGQPNGTNHSTTSTQSWSRSFPDRQALGRQPSLDAAKTYLVEGFQAFAKFLQPKLQSTISAAREKLSELLPRLHAKQALRASAPAKVPTTNPVPRWPANRLSQVWAVVLILGLVCLAILDWTNVAGFALTKLQSWPRALLFTATLLWFPLAAEIAIEQSPSRSRWFFRGTLALLGASAGLIFVGTIANRFALTLPVGSHVALLAGHDYRLQLASQLVTVIAVSTAFLLALRKILVVPTDLIDNPDIPVIEAQISVIEAQVKSVQAELSNAEGQLAALPNLVQIKVCEGLAVYEELKQDRQARAAALDTFFSQATPELTLQ